VSHRISRQNRFLKLLWTVPVCLALPGFPHAQDFEIKLLGSWNLPVPTNAFTLTVREAHAFVGLASGDLHIVDVSNPALPVAAGTISVTGWVSGCTLDGPTAYVSTGVGDVCAVDVRNPSAPRILDTVQEMKFARGSAVREKFLYVAGFEPSLAVFDSSDPTDLRRIGHWESGRTGSDVFFHGGYAYLSEEGLVVLDISDTTRPQEIGRVQETPETLTEIESM